MRLTPKPSPMPNEIWWKWANFAVLAGGLVILSRSTRVLSSVHGQRKSSRGFRTPPRFALKPKLAPLRSRARSEISPGKSKILKATSKAEIADRGRTNAG